MKAIGILRCIVVTLGGMVGGCAAVPKGELGVAVAESSAGVTVAFGLDAQLPSGLGARSVLPGETLSPGESVALTVRVDRPAYLYAARITPTGEVEAFFPLRGQQRKLLPCMPLRIPEDPMLWLALKEEADRGEQSVAVVASERPLAHEELVVAVRQAAVGEAMRCTPGADAQGGKKDDKKEDKKDAREPCDTKKSDECKRGGAERLRARADQWRVAAVRFPFNQR